jgi:hypothetical protein
MTDAVGVENPSWPVSPFRPKACFIPAQGNALGSLDIERFAALKARFIGSKVRTSLIDA